MNNLNALRMNYLKQRKVMTDHLLDELTTYFIKKYICKFIKNPQFVQRYIDIPETPKFYVNGDFHNDNFELSIDLTLKLDQEYLNIRAKPDIGVQDYLNIRICMDDYSYRRFYFTYFKKKAMEINLLLPIEEETLKVFSTDEKTIWLANMINYFSNIINETPDGEPEINGKFYKDIFGLYDKMYSTDYLLNLPGARTVWMIGKYRNRLTGIPYDITKIIAKYMLC